MRILLLNLPWEKNGYFGVRAGSRWPFISRPESDGKIHYIPFPFFLAYAAALLKREGKDAKLIDAIAEGMDEQKTADAMTSFSPALLVVETSTPSFNNDIKTVLDFHTKMPSCRVVLCGPHASVYAVDILQEHPFVEFILIGEYEFTLLHLINALETGQALAGVTGLVYRQGGVVKHNQPGPLLEDLDSLPWPERETVPLYHYNDGFAGLPQPNVQVWSSRGCIFPCTFCLWPQAMYGGAHYRMRKVNQVIDEVVYLINCFQFKALYFDDDVFNIDRGHVTGICHQMRSKNIRIPWAAMARADLMDEELLDTLAAAGLYAVKYGVESASSAVLYRCRKQLDLQKSAKMIAYTKKCAIKVHLTFCIGLPGETKKSIEETRRFIDAVRPDSLQISFATPFPGTEYFEYVRSNGYLLSGDWSDYDGNRRCVVRTEQMGMQDLEGAYRDLCHHFDLG